MVTTDGDTMSTTSAYESRAPATCTLGAVAAAADVELDGRACTARPRQAADATSAAPSTVRAALLACNGRPKREFMVAGILSKEVTLLIRRREGLPNDYRNITKR
jgi:hypothetical protein